MPSNSSLRPTAVGSLVLRLRRWPGLVASWGQYHGMWGPGVRALRNQSLRSKTALVAGLCLLLGASLFIEVAQLRWAQWRSVHAALDDIVDLRAFVHWQGAVLRLQVAAAQAERTPADAGSAAVLAQAFEAEAAGLRGLAEHRGAASTADRSAWQRAWEQAAAARQQLLSRCADMQRGPDGQGGPRLAAATELADTLPMLQGVTLRRLTQHARQGSAERAPGDEVVRRAIALALRLNALALAGSGGEGADMPRLRERLVEARVALRALRDEGDAARDLLAGQALAFAGYREQVAEWLAGLAALDAPVRPPEAVLGRQSAAAREAAQAMALLGSAAVEQLLVGERDALAKALALRAALLLACLMVGGYLLVCMYKVMVGGLGFLCSQVDELGRGNLAIRPSGHGQDEIGQALTALFFILFQHVYLGLVAFGMVIIQAVIIPRMRRRLLVLSKERQIAARQLAGARRPALARGRQHPPRCPDEGRPQGRVGLAPGMAPALCFMAIRNFMGAVNRPEPGLWITLAAIPTNGVLGYALIHGHWGMPKLELLGAGVDAGEAPWNSCAPSLSR